MRLIFVPQYPSKLRYQEWWATEFPKNLKHYFDEIVTIGGYNAEEIFQAKPGDFSPIDQSIHWECEQIKEYMGMKLYHDDVMFIADLSFPGLFPNILHHKRPSKVFMFCHGTSLNNFDYFEKTRLTKMLIEKCHAALSDAVFVGSQYHVDKLNWENAVVTRLPYPPFETYTLSKDKQIISVSRPTKQKVDLEAEKKVMEHFNLDIHRPQNLQTWKDYYKFVASSEIMLITSCEETFGYQVVDAVLNGCIPIAPNSFSYRELLPHKYLYDSETDMLCLIEQALDGILGVPELKCDREMKNFYQNLAYYMRG